MTCLTILEKFIRRFNTRANVVNAVVNGAGKDSTVAISMQDGKFEIYKSNGTVIRRSWKLSIYKKIKPPINRRFNCFISSLTYLAFLASISTTRASFSFILALSSSLIAKNRIFFPSLPWIFNHKLSFQLFINSWPTNWNMWYVSWYLEELLDMWMYQRSTLSSRAGISISEVYNLLRSLQSEHTVVTKQANVSAGFWSLG